MVPSPGVSRTRVPDPFWSSDYYYKNCPNEIVNWLTPSLPYKLRLVLGIIIYHLLFPQSLSKYGNLLISKNCYKRKRDSFCGWKVTCVDFKLRWSSKLPDLFYSQVQSKIYWSTKAKAKDSDKKSIRLWHTNTKSPWKGLSFWKG